MEINIPSLLRIKPDAILKIGKYLRQENFSNIALYWGEGLKDLFYETIKISLISSEISIDFEEEVLTNDINDAFASSKKLPGNIDAIISIGGGKVIDFCKYISFIKHLPQIAVPTLISNDAFASPISSLSVDGKRKSVKTTVPHGIIIDTSIIANAPVKYLYSGIGDLFCKTTSIFDWKLAYKKTGEYVNDFSTIVAENATDNLSFYKNKDFSDLKYINVIASSLLMTGVSMIIAGSSRPASGSEHLISHAYDSIAKKTALHGLQVGVASYAVSFLQQKTHERLKQDITETGFYDFMKKNPLDKEDFIKAIILAPEIKENFYTILNERKSISKLTEFVQKDELMNEMLV